MLKSQVTKEEYVQAVKDELVKLLDDGEPCYHPGCLSHVTHPCEVCGRIAGVRIKKENDNE
jgi:hypothetical protein